MCDSSIDVQIVSSALKKNCQVTTEVLPRKTMYKTKYSVGIVSKETGARLVGN